MLNMLFLTLISCRFSTRKKGEGFKAVVFDFFSRSRFWALNGKEYFFSHDRSLGKVVRKILIAQTLLQN